MAEIRIDPERFFTDIGVYVDGQMHTEYDPNFHQVWPTGEHANGLNVYRMMLSPEGYKEGLEKIAPSLAWVSFYSYNKATKGEDFIDNKFVAERNPDGLVFLTEAQILDEGELRPDMAAWLGALVRRGRFGSREVEPLIRLL